MMNKISVVIITFNEARNILRCLASVRDVADEIIVLDSFSTDQTEEICSDFAKNFGALHFIKRAWQGYSNTKNYANSLATHSHILSLDADEALSDNLKKSILNFKKNKKPNDVARFNRLTHYCGVAIWHCGWYPDCKIRLFNKNITHWEGDIHENLVHNAPLTIHFLEGDLLHYSFATHEELVLQLQKFSTIAAKARFEKGEKASFFKIFYKTCFKFFRNYILKKGFLDGKNGFIISFWTAKETFWRYSKLRNLHKAIF